MSAEPMTEEALDGIELRSAAGFRPSPGEGLALAAEVRRLRAVVDRARELVAASRHTDDCAAVHHEHCTPEECDYDDLTPEECARAYREDCECGLRGL